MRVLLVEGDLALAAEIRRGLVDAGMAVDLAVDGASALEKLALVGYPVVLLDRDLPGGTDLPGRLAKYLPADGITVDGILSNESPGETSPNRPPTGDRNSRALPSDGARPADRPPVNPSPKTPHSAEQYPADLAEGPAENPPGNRAGKRAEEAAGESSAADRAVGHAGGDFAGGDFAGDDCAGDAVCRWIARSGHPARVLMLATAGSVADRVAGLELGADDYLVKPFAMAELVARTRVLGRRADRAAPRILRWSDLELDPIRHIARRRGTALRLTRKEFGVLEVLMRAQGAPVGAEELLEQVWDENTDPFTNAVRITVMTLRRKLGEPGPIETVTGVGYRLINTDPRLGR